TKSGYHFIGWYLDEELTQAYEFDTAFRENTTLYAYFSESIPIRTVEDLLAIPSGATAKYYLVNDINLEGQTLTASLGDFAGEFNGEGHKIYNFILTLSSATAGFFNTNSGTIKNVTFEGFSFSANASFHGRTGIIAGINTGIISNCKVLDGEVSYTQSINWKEGEYYAYYGVLSGSNSGTISNCVVEAKLTMYTNRYYGYYDGDIVNTVYVGGVVGANQNGTVEGVTSNVQIIATVRNHSDNSSSDAQNILRVGGVLGENSGSVINCHGNIDLILNGEGNITRRPSVGGFVSTNQTGGSINGCSLSGTITNGNTSFTGLYIGGFVENQYASVENCFADVDISTSMKGCIAGFVCTADKGGTTAYCYSTGSITSTASSSNIGGFVRSAVSGSSISCCFSTTDIESASTSNTKAFAYSVGTSAVLFRCYYNTEASFTLSGAETEYTDSNATGIDTATMQSEDFVYDTVYWDREIWNVTDGEYPTLK
ncbi:MAG: hypothetical protein E7667_07740, partial [Ruminococcaceae bacterium]|nr:hypothetical protein [Oscillospiraceae bacterium]